jgi:hypothetical protein
MRREEPVRRQESLRAEEVTLAGEAAVFSPSPSRTLAGRVGVGAEPTPPRLASLADPPRQGEGEFRRAGEPRVPLVDHAQASHMRAAKVSEVSMSSSRR